ncbi:MAG TPA: Hpt domain-containing protein, partial [Chroococcidiopsis sp.]
TLVRWMPHLQVKAGDRLAPVDEPPPEYENLPGLNIKLGVARLSGNWTAYQRLLKRFYQTHQTAAAEIQTALEQAVLTRMFYLTHSIKGAGGNIGAEALFQSASDLEHMLQTQSYPSPDRLNRLIVAFLRDLQQALSSIALVVNPAAAPAAYSGALTSDSLEVTGLVANASDEQTVNFLREVIELLEQDLVMAIARFEFVKQAIVNTPLQSLTPAVEARLADFDTDGARQLLSHMINTLLNARP